MTVFALAAGALLLAGCNGTTYGTGRSPGMQTIEDLAGIAALGSKKEPITYTDRAPVVKPPSTGQLPVPTNGSPNVVAANWPDDPDERERQFQAEREARRVAALQNEDRAPLNQYDPKFRLPPGSTPPPTRPNYDPDYDPAKAAMGSSAENERARKAWAQSQSNGAFDADGNPVRRYLTDPPVAYRQPDPTAPVAVTKDCVEPKRRWFQRKPDPQDCPPSVTGAPSS